MRSRRGEFLRRLPSRSTGISRRESFGHRLVNATELTNMLHLTTFPISEVSTGIQDPDVRALLSQSQPAGMTFYPVDSMIYAQGDATGALYLVEFGTVRVLQVTPDGRRQITSFCFPGDVFGLEPGTEHEFAAESVDGAGVRAL